ncbi:MAG: isocitrate dehydrogenase kinase/phosphatase-domain containing protein [Rugosibacter sp.]|jgi:isocitrate dehydrogenase kinase/phosphatase
MLEFRVEAVQLVKAGLSTGNTDSIEHAVLDYGDAIRELAIANIFPGDRLWKN